MSTKRRRGKRSGLAQQGLSQLRATSGQLLGLGAPCLPQSFPPLSLFMRQVPDATVDTTSKANKQARRATRWDNIPRARHARVVVTYTDAGWATRPDSLARVGS